MMFLVKETLRIILISLAKLIWDIIKICIPLKYRMKNVAGEIALITGGASGLGRSIALELSNLDVIVVIWDINENGMKETIKLVQDTGGICYGYVCNVTNREEVYEKAAQLKKEVGQVTILINNAGGCNITTFQETPDDLLFHTINLNLISHFWTVKAFLPGMIESNRGHIVGISSLITYAGIPLCTDYSASKHGICGFYDVLDKELIFLRQKINITVVCPIIIHSTGIQADLYISRRSIFIMSPKKVAAETVIAMRCNIKEKIIPGFIKLFLPLVWIFPWGYLQFFHLYIKWNNIHLNSKLIDK